MWRIDKTIHFFLNTFSKDGHSDNDHYNQSPGDHGGDSEPGEEF
jgi:hypothetical protein